MRNAYCRRDGSRFLRAALGLAGPNQPNLLSNVPAQHLQRKITLADLNCAWRLRMRIVRGAFNVSDRLTPRVLVCSKILARPCDGIGAQPQRVIRNGWLVSQVCMRRVTSLSKITKSRCVGIVWLRTRAAPKGSMA